MQRIDAELAELKKSAEFPLKIRPVVRVRNAQEAAPLRDGDADLMLVYGDRLKETGYALRKMGVGWLNLTTERCIEAGLNTTHAGRVARISASGPL